MRRGIASALPLNRWEEEGGSVIGRSHEAKSRSFSGVHFDVLVSGSESMVTKMKYKEGDQVLFHSHPNIQSGYVLSGRYRLRTHDIDETVVAGDSYSIPGGLEHTIEVLEPGEVIDVFVPPREDYL
jgi:quercetin dioxygenase-like cupin family protein